MSELGNNALAVKAEIERRLFGAMQEAGRSALGMPGTVDTFHIWLERAGLALVLGDGKAR